MDRVRIGILGVSWWTELVWPGFSSVEDVDITWIASRSGEKAKTFAEEHGIANWTDDYAELITSKDVDAVFIGVPNHLHEEMVRLRGAHHGEGRRRRIHRCAEPSSRGDGNRGARQRQA